MFRETCGIYQIINLYNGKSYIGQSYQIEHRFTQHRSELRGGYHSNRHLQAAWNKYGEENFTYFILAYCDKDRLTFFEQACMDKLKPEYNLCPAAQSTLGYKHTEATRAKMSKYHKENPTFKDRKHTLESRNKMSQARIGNTNCVGRKYSQETLLKFSQATSRNRLGKKHSAETKERMRKAQLRRFQQGVQ